MAEVSVLCASSGRIDLGGGGGKPPGVGKNREEVTREGLLCSPVLKAVRNVVAGGLEKKKDEHLLGQRCSEDG